MKTGSEIYGNDLNEHGIKKDQPITVVASRPDRDVNAQPKNQNVYLLPSETESVSLDRSRPKLGSLDHSIDSRLRNWEVFLQTRKRQVNHGCGS
jgi:hypothetical protein